VILIEIGTKKDGTICVFCQRDNGHMSPNSCVSWNIVCKQENLLHYTKWKWAFFLLVQDIRSCKLVLKCEWSQNKVVRSLPPLLYYCLRARNISHIEQSGSNWNFLYLKRVLHETIFNFRSKRVMSVECHYFIWICHWFVCASNEFVTKCPNSGSVRKYQCPLYTRII